MNSRVRAAIYCFISQHNIDRNRWKNFAIFTARTNLDSAPPQISVLLAGKPSQVPANVCELAEIFTLLYFTTQDRAISSNTFFSAAEVWEHAIRLWEAPRG